MPYTFRKSGVFYFQRMVPQDLAHHYRTPRIAFSLRTRSRSEAQRVASDLSSKLDEQWRSLRGSPASVLDGFLKQPNTPTPAPLSPLPVGAQPGASAGLMSEAVELYLKHKGAGKPNTFSSAARRALGYLTSIAGDKPLNDYTRRDATSFRDELFNRGMAGSSVSRTFTTVKAVFNFACAEWGLDARNPFAGVYFDRAKGVTQREPFSDDEIRQVQAACKETDDELRWILALLADTGARLAEIVGLAREDVELDHPDGPMLHIRPHPWRTLKTRSSQRSIPLVGSSLWAAQQATAETRGMHLFPRYTDDARCNANSASAALSKWLKNNLKAGRTVHSLRHSMRDRLRAVECPPDIVDQIGGWAPSGVGASYGRGYPLAVLREWMERTALGG